MMNHIRHNYPSLIRCLRVFHILVLTYLLSRCYCYNHYKITKTLLLLSLLLLPLPPLSYYCATKHFATNTKFPGVVELTTQLLILENILWLPLCRINKFWLNTLPSKIVAIPYTCGSSRALGPGATFGVLGTGVPRLACLRPMAWLHQRPGTAHPQWQPLKTLARGQASRG